MIHCFYDLLAIVLCDLEMDHMLAPLKVKLKVRTLDITPLCESSPQMRSGIAGVLKRSHSYLRAVGRKVLWSLACVCLCVCLCALMGDVGHGQRAGLCPPRTQ